MRRLPSLEITVNISGAAKNGIKGQELQELAAIAKDRDLVGHTWPSKPED